MDFDVHQHLDYGTDIDAYAERLRRLKLRAGVSSCGPIFGQPGNDAVEEALRKHPDVVVGFGYVGLGRGDSARTVEQLHRRGFKALKVIIPKSDYDDKAFWPIYRKAEHWGCPSSSTLASWPAPRTSPPATNTSRRWRPSTTAPMTSPAGG